jgi:hypothetical protein
MKSIVSKSLEPKKDKIIKTSLALTLVVFAFTMSSPYSFFQIVKPAEAAGALTSVSIVPTSNRVNTKDITGNHDSTSFMKTIRIQDNSKGDAHGWNPNGVAKEFTIFGIRDVGDDSSVVKIVNTTPVGCMALNVVTHAFDMHCDNAVANNAALIFTVINPPVRSCCSIANSTPAIETIFSPPGSMFTSSPFTSLH